MNFPKKQIQLSQLELHFKGPLIADSVVNSLSDLTTLTNSNSNYLHKMVWVRDVEAYYYLTEELDSTILYNWKKLSNKLTIEQYTNKIWFTDEIVHLNGRIYKCLQETLSTENPVDYPNKWLIITGEPITQRINFIESNSFVFYTPIKNPFFVTYICEFELDSNNDFILDSDNLIKMSGNVREIEADITKRDDLPDNLGKAYELKIWENKLTANNYTGVINIK